MEFFRQEYWSGLPFPSRGDLPDPGIEPMSPALRADSLLSESPGKPHVVLITVKSRVTHLFTLLISPLWTAWRQGCKTESSFSPRFFTKRVKVHLIYFIFKFNLIFIYLISWRLITLQYCSGFCHTLTWISHGFTCAPHPHPQPRCPSADEWIRKLWYIYTMEYYSAIKKNSFESVLMRWMKLEPIIQSEISQKDKDQYSILTHIYGI